MPYCPRCESDSLQQQRPRGWKVHVDVCSKCGGMWFDTNELSSVLPQAVEELAIPKKAKEAQRVCPKCNRILYMFNYPKTMVAVEMCRQCGGLWLDPGEYSEIKTIRGMTEGKGTGAGFPTWNRKKNSFWELILKTMHE